MRPEIGIGLALEAIREDLSLVARRFSSKGPFVRFNDNAKMFVNVDLFRDPYFGVKDQYIPTGDDMTATDWMILSSDDIYQGNGYYKDTMNHVGKVRTNLQMFIDDLAARAVNHDFSKFTREEFEVMNETFPDLRGTTYGTPEYAELLKRIKPALDYHYKRNDHHPEHHENGVNGMNLMQVVEMLCDWKAAAERHADGDPFDSLNKNKERFGLSDQLYFILQNTLKAWKDVKEPSPFIQELEVRK